MDSMLSWASLVAQTVKNLPAMQETQIQSLGQEDPLEKGMAIHCSILAWRIPWTEVHGRLWSMGSQRVGPDRVTLYAHKDLFKKIRDTKGTFIAKTGTVKDRNCMDLTEAEDIKKR